MTLNIVGGHLALDLVNTVEPRGQAGGTDHLRTPPDLARWASSVGLDAPVDPDALPAVLEIREATYEVLLALLGRPVDATYGLAELSRHWSASIARSPLVLADGRVRLELRSLVDRLADAAVDLVRTVDVRQLKECPPAQGGCGWLFLDRSRNGSRRWCAMEDCGTQAKARRLTARRRSARGAQP